MPRGGYRAGAGRPKGSSPSAPEPNRTRINIAAKKAGLSPLDYMLQVMNDEEADASRRDRMAVAAAPFVHAKPGDAPKGKKEEAEEASRSAGVGTDWGSDLAPTVN